MQSLQRVRQIVRIREVEKWRIQHAIYHFDVGIILYSLQKLNSVKTNVRLTNWRHLLAAPTDVLSMECTELDRGQPISK